MNAVNLLLLSFALAADSFAVSVINGLSTLPPTAAQRFFGAALFGAFQAGMPVLGYLAGMHFALFVSSYSHYVALALLCALGVKMLISAALQARSPVPLPRRIPLYARLAQAVATSIDALSVGIGFAILSVPILPAALCIGAVTFVCCLFGFDLGKRFGAVLADRAVLVGGLLLIAIGLFLFFSRQAPVFLPVPLWL